MRGSTLKCIRQAGRGGSLDPVNVSGVDNSGVLGIKVNGHYNNIHYYFNKLNL